MLIPSIDLMGGRVVQLVQGEKLALGFDDLEYWINRFKAYPLVQLIDLDAAKRQGNNRPLLDRILQRLPCQVGGGIHRIEDARDLLAAGARRVIFGSALFAPPGHSQPALSQAAESNPKSWIRHNFAEQLAKSFGTDCLVFSVDTKQNRVAVRGWQDRIELRPEDAIAGLEPFCGAFLYTNVDTEGTMQGFPMDVARSLRRLTTRQLIVAGGIRQQSEIDELDAINVDAVAGMAIYSGAMQA
ncbi:MAG TPA: HisA/HisF-related TIM barrel protein [Acidobacteriaceae bacterium]|nr:HisA/HisF-related TIM barrel protein [Acidobacteriaceae bacterium]